MKNFPFTDYRVSSRRWDHNGTEVCSHTLELFSRGDGGDSAVLVFDAELDTSKLGNVVGYATRIPEEGTSVVGWLPLEQFEAFRKILGKGGDLSLHYVLRAHDADTGYISQIGIGPTRTMMHLAKSCRPANFSGAPVRRTARM